MQGPDRCVAMWKEHNNNNNIVFGVFVAFVKLNLCAFIRGRDTRISPNETL